MRSITPTSSHGQSRLTVMLQSRFIVTSVDCFKLRFLSEQFAHAMLSSSKGIFLIALG